jgi:import inner membrane translocase subunit TIM23
MKQGSATANTLGVLAVMYSGFGVLLSWGRGRDDELNTLTAATATGLLYKSTGEDSHLVCRLQHLYSLC